MTGKFDKVRRQLVSPTVQDLSKRQRGVQLSEFAAGDGRLDTCNEFIKRRLGEIHNDKLSLSLPPRQA